MSTASPDSQWQLLRRSARTVVVVDLVESVRLIDEFEEETVRRWQAFVGDVVERLLPLHGGRLVKSLGDGLLLEFESVRPAIQCAIDMQQAMTLASEGQPAIKRMWLRIGAHVADVIVDKLDIYGSGVNLAARLMTLAKPGDIVVSEQVNDQLVAGIDADTEDLGLSFFKHRVEPVRAYRVQAAAKRSLFLSGRPSASPLVPTIAVIPFEGLAVAPEHEPLGDLLAHDVISRLSVHRSVRVISQLSSAVVRRRGWGTVRIGEVLGATYIVSGRFQLSSGQLILLAEIADARSDEVVWAEQVRSSQAEVVHFESKIADTLCGKVIEVIAANELRRVRTLAVPSLEGFSLQLAATVLMHRSTRAEFDRSRDLLEHLIERYSQSPEPRAWLAQWYVLRVTRGFVVDPAEESARALEHTRRALDASPESSMALAVEGFVHCHMLRDLDAADDRLDRAIEANPNDPLAWIFKCSVQTFRGQGEAAMASADRAVELSPIDPMRHYFEALASSAAVSAGRLSSAIDLATRALKANRNHLPTLRALAIAQVESGDGAAANETGRRILELEPGFTLRQYLDRVPRGGEATRARFATALQEAGIPAQ